MFARRFFAARMFAPRYFPQSQGEEPDAPVVSLSGSRPLRMRRHGYI